jgi:GntR family transcriptional regulator
MLSMQFVLDKSQKGTLLKQARDQLIAALHMGKLKAGDRLPSVRQVALSNNINLKSAFTIYQRLHDEGYIDLRRGSGAYISYVERTDLNRAYCLSLLQLIKSNIFEAERLKVKPRDYSKLVQSFVERLQRKGVRVAVIECNEEQVSVFASEIADQLNVRTHPLLLSQLESPSARLSQQLAKMNYFATTDFHFREVKELISRYRKIPFQLRLNPEFVPQIIAAAREGRMLMVVSNTSFFPAFRRSLLDLGTPRVLVDRITALDCSNPALMRRSVSQVETVYVSSACDQRIHKLIPRHVREIKFDSHLSQESLDALEAVMLYNSD